jgi:hypothetical protein
VIAFTSTLIIAPPPIAFSVFIFIFLGIVCNRQRLRSFPGKKGHRGGDGTMRKAIEGNEQRYRMDGTRLSSRRSSVESSSPDMRHTSSACVRGRASGNRQTPSSIHGRSHLLYFLL